MHAIAFFPEVWEEL